MTDLWVKMAAVFYGGKEYDVAEAMGRENYFSPVAASMLEVIAEEVKDQEVSAYFKEQAQLAREAKRL